MWENVCFIIVVTAKKWWEMLCKQLIIIQVWLCGLQLVKPYQHPAWLSSNIAPLLVCTFSSFFQLCFSDSLLLPADRYYYQWPLTVLLDFSFKSIIFNTPDGPMHMLLETFFQNDFSRIKQRSSKMNGPSKSKPVLYPVLMSSFNPIPSCTFAAGYPCLYCTWDGYWTPPSPPRNLWPMTLSSSVGVTHMFSFPLFEAPAATYSLNKIGVWQLQVVLLKTLHLLLLYWKQAPMLNSFPRYVVCILFFSSYSL